MLTEELKQIADTYRITIVNPTESYRREHNLPSDKWLLKVIYGNKAMKDGVWETIRAHKQEYIDYILAKKEAERQHFQEYNNKVNSIPGVKEIEKADEEWENYNARWNNAMESEDAAVILPSIHKPDSDPAKLRKEYPQAAAYLAMQELSFSDNYELASIGEKAVAMVVEGKWKEALKFAEEEKEKFVNRHMWD